MWKVVVIVKKCFKKLWKKKNTAETGFTLQGRIIDSHQILQSGILLNLNNVKQWRRMT